MPGLLEALQASVWCLHELRLEKRTVGGVSRGPSGPLAAPQQPMASVPASPPDGATPAAHGPAPAPPPASKRLVTLQHRLLLAKILEDNRLMGRRRVDSWRLSRSLEEVSLRLRLRLRLSLSLGLGLSLWA